MHEQFIQGAEREDFAVVDDADARTEARRLLHVVRGVNDRDSVTIEPLQMLEDGVARLRIDADGGLVAKQEFRVVQERGDEVEPALHAAGEGLHERAAAVGELRGGEGLVDAGPQFGTAQALEFAEDPEVFVGGEFRKERDGLRHQAEGATSGTSGGRNRPAVEGDRAGLGGAQAGGERHQRGLAGAVGTEQTEKLARGDLQRDAVKRGDAAEAFGDVAEGEHGLNS